MIAGISYFSLNPYRAASSIAFVALTFLATAGHASAQTFVDTLHNCEFRKAYAVTIKLLAVYASHILTIKVEPGLGQGDTLRLYVAAALLPSSSAHIPITDFMFIWKWPQFSGINQIHRNCVFPWRWLRSNGVNHRRSMQMAINCGAACVRLKRTDPRRPSDAKAKVVPTSYIVRAKPLRIDEDFIMVPRGTPADLFVETMIQSRSSVMKALIGGAQIYFATLQLLSVADPQVAAYGYGAFTYTIIPYALGSTINLIALFVTGNYVDLTEMEIEMVLETDTIQWKPDDINEDVVMGIGLVEFIVYLAVVGGITGFRSGISSHAQRGWFMSWALIGTLYGAVVRIAFPRRAIYQSRESISWVPIVLRAWERMPMNQRAGHRMPMVERVGDGLPTAERAGDGLPMVESVGDGLPVAERADGTRSKEFMVELWKTYMIGICGIATVGGIVTMIQQYMHLFQC